MAKISSIRAKLFRNFSLLIIGIELLVFLSFFLFYSNVLREQNRDFLNSLAVSLSEWMDDEILYMEDVAFRIAYSSLVFDSLSESRKRNSPVFDFYMNRDLMDVLNVSMGYYRRVLQINLYTLNNTVLRSGYESDIQAMDVQKKGWYRDLLQEKKMTSLPYYDEDLRRDVIALRMAYFNTNNKVIGVIEILNDYKFIQKKANSLLNAAERPSISLIFLDDRERVIFPANPGELEGRIVSSVKSSTGKVRFFSGNQRSISSIRSKNSDWTTMVASDEEALHSEIISFGYTYLAICLLSLLLSLSVSYSIAYHLSSPIDRINRLIRHKTADRIPEIPPGGMNSGIREVENLYTALYTMQCRLKKSLKETLTAQEEEMRAKIIALYAQMNPHFLYNVLSIISAMAEEHDREGVISVTGELSSMLRYISSETGPQVPLQEELEHCKSYLRLMKHRYEEHFHYRIELSPKLSERSIPKLSIQPFVENIFKHSFTGRPPWEVLIQIEEQGDGWAVRIEDNGCGFEPFRAEEIMQKIRKLRIDPEMDIPELDGMGIMNICMRMKLQFPGRFSFRIGRSPLGGAQIVMQVREGADG